MNKAVAFSTLWGLLLLGCSTPAPVEGVLFIHDVNLIDGTGRPLQNGIDVLILNGVIGEIGSGLQAPPGAEVVEANGKYLTPGLIDAHVHLDAPVVSQLSAEERKAILRNTPRAFLYNGVTTVLNLGSNAEWIREMQQQQRSRKLIAPRIYATGESFSPAGGWGYGEGLDDAGAARDKALEDVAGGTDGFKVVLEDGLGRSGTYREMPPDMLDAIVEVARESQTPIYVHAINIEEYRRAVAIQPRAIVHGLEDPISEGDPILQELVAKNIIVVPTQSLFESFIGMEEDLEDPVLKGSVPAFLRDKLGSREFVTEEQRIFTEYARMEVYPWVRDRLPIFRENISKMHRAGVKLAVGTDGGGAVGYNYQGYNTPWELALLVEAGLTPMEAIQAATSVGAEVIGVSDRLGTIETGKWADLLILEANPLDDIRHIRKIEFIVQDGKLHQREEFAVEDN